MRKILVSTILGVGIAGTANASIVSSGFLDEKLTEYALSTSLDLKANQSDFTELNTQISNSIDSLKTLWNSEIGILADGFNPNKVNNDIEGAFGLVGGFIVHSMQSLTGGWTDKTDGTTYLGIKDLNTKIGPLPDDITVLHMLEGWTDPSGYYFPGLFDLASNTFKFNNLFPKTSIGMLLAHGLEEYTNGNYTGPVYPLWKLSEGIDKIGSIETKIGTLPAGYDSVGAALTAIKGIAEDAKAAALAAIPDPKQEGSSGKFVLTVDIVGDNATYHWEKIDREGETTTTE
ncbi:MAG: hypothetical protein IJN91_02825 [Alphaproteobacteria bacterium]|nr:hypothetical protein [Alphaproteobacteria bacterium]